MASFYLFVFFEEPARQGILTRTTTVLKALQFPYEMKDEITQNPRKYGIVPTSEFAKAGEHIVTRPAEHALGAKPSIFTSASQLPDGGAPNITGNARFYIDIEIARKYGAEIVTPEQLISDLKTLLHEKPHLESRITRLISAIQNVERETLVKGRIPSGAIMAESEIAALGKIGKFCKGLFVLGIGLTAYDMGKATLTSIERRSYKPVAAETIRQAGGWGAPSQERKSVL